jgi:uncharacterized membrane protein
MDFSFQLWLEYLIRFSHLVAGIAWIGSSFYFIWLDSAFTPPEQPRRNVEGELFMVHGGFYYQVEKRKVFPGELPKVLHWFKWEATLTWITGFLLLVVLYYLRGATLLIDPAVRDLAPLHAVGLSLGILTVSWFLYDLIWHPRFAGWKPVSVALSVAGLTGLVYLNTRLFSGRGAFIQTGAILGSLMLLNVWVRILPGQRRMIRDAEAGKIPDYSFSKHAKTRSVHNTYFIFPVLFIMLSNHYTTVTNHPQNWLLLLVLSVSGALVRHAMVTNVPAQRWTLAPAAFGLVALVWMTNAQQAAGNAALAAAAAGGGEAVPFSRVHAVVLNRCTSCHAGQNTDDVFKVAPNGMVLESEAQIRAAAEKIYQKVVVEKSMPFLGNKTGLTEDERSLIARWYQQSRAPTAAH